MAFDQSKIGQLAAELMESLEPQYTEAAEIGAVALVVEIISPEHGSQIASKYSDQRRHVNLGLLEMARNSLTNA